MLQRGDFIQTRDRKIVGRILGFLSWGYIVEQRDGSRWIFIKENSEATQEKF